MALPRLTHNQISVLSDCATGSPRGRALAAVPSLVKRGLVVVHHTLPTPPPRNRGYLPHTRGSTSYKITPLGLEVYEHHRTKWYENALSTLEGGFRNDLARARGSVVEAPVPADEGQPVENFQGVSCDE
jgi:hypothetical protein